MMLVDVHCHLELFGPEAESVVKMAMGAGVKAIITAGISPESNRKALGFARQFPVVKAALGIYPINELSGAAIEEELKFIEANKKLISAVGEIGLDGKEGKSELQKPLFEKLLSLAQRIGKPAIVHSRQAESDVLEIISKHKCNVVLHAFHGSISLVKKAVEMGCYFSIPANVVRSDHFQRLVKEVPLSQLLTETDAPFLAPERENRSEPSMVALSVVKIAELKGLSADDAANIIFSNYQRLFSR
ncbi:MAG: TatD family hydrolase [Candidatus Woesearchaeota archaeon]